MGSAARTVLCYSGGLDSTVLMYHLRQLGHELTCLFFSYGARHQDREMACAEELCRLDGVELRIIDLSFVGRLFHSSLLAGDADLPLGHQHDPVMRSTVVPGRNSIFASIALGFAESTGANHVALANHRDDQPIYPDTRPRWVAAVDQMMQEATEGKVSVLAPFTQLSRVQICKRAVELHVPIEKTWSCYAGGPRPCGSCGSCRERAEAMAQIGITEA